MIDRFMSKRMTGLAVFCLALLLGGVASSVKWSQDAVPADQSDTVGTAALEDAHHDDRSAAPLWTVLPAGPRLACLPAVHPDGAIPQARARLPLDRAAVSRGPPETLASSI